MPFYFAYGANLNQAAMAERCPATRAIGLAQLPAHRFIIMRDGYATLVPAAPERVVHGLLWDLATSDIPALDSYEEVDGGLYRKTGLVVMRNGRGIEAMVYLATNTAEGRPVPGYMEAVVRAAEGCGLPKPYCDELRSWLPHP